MWLQFNVERIYLSLIRKQQSTAGFLKATYAPTSMTQAEDKHLLIIPEDLQEIKELCHERSFAGRKGRAAMDSVMLMAQLREQSRGRSDVHGREIHSAFNSIDTRVMCDLIEDRDLKRWVKAFLAPRSFQIKTNRIIGEARMTGGTPQGSLLSPSPFTIYMSSTETSKTWTGRSLKQQSSN